jgi:Uncharacterized protein conserved in bacteria (DUF2252)
MKRYRKYYGMALARAHAHTGSASAITGDLRNSGKDDKSLGRFRVAYAEQTVRDHKSIVEAIYKEVVPTRFETD